MKAVNVKERLSYAAEKCPGLPEEVYQFAEYLSAKMNDELMPTGVTMAISTALADLSAKLPPHRSQLEDPSVKSFRAMVKCARYVLQVFDVVLDREFTDEVRAECEEAFGWRPVRRVEVSAEYREKCKNVIGLAALAAGDWWTGAIQLTEKGVLANGLPRMYKEFTPEEIEAFWFFLCFDTQNELDRYDIALLRTDYGPADRILVQAAERAGIKECDYLFLFPSKTHMCVCPDKVEILPGYETSSKIIWKAE